MRVLVVSDIHGNLPALEAVLQQPITFDTVWNLGDTVGYGPWPNECISLIRSYANSVHLSGNHDLAATRQISTNGFNPVAARAADWTSEQLTPEHCDWLRSNKLTDVQGEVTLAHGSPRDPAFEYIFTSGQAAQNFAHFSTKLCFVGHTHRPMIAVDGISVAVDRPYTPAAGQEFDLSPGRTLLNPGSVGQPRDGDPRAAFGVFDSERMRFTFHRVSYPIEVTQKAILDAGLPAVLAQRLATGQ